MDRQPVPLESSFGSAGHVVRGILWPAGPAWAILLHDLDDTCDADSWGTLPSHLVQAGLSTLAFDLPGFGLSDGTPHMEDFAAATRSVINAAYDRGCERLFLVTVGDSLSIIEQENDLVHPDALVAISPLSGHSDDRPTLGSFPKLAIGSSIDGRDATGLKDFLRRNQGWTLTSSFGVPERGHALLADPLAGKIGNQIVTFLRPYQRGGSFSPRWRPTPIVPGHGQLP